MGADLRALYTLVPPGQILFASDAPYGNTLMSGVTQIRLALQLGLSHDQIRSIMSEQSLRIAAGEPLQPAGPAVGEGDRAPHVLLDRVAQFLMMGMILSIRAPDAGPEMLALAQLACDVPDEIDDAPVFAALRPLLAAYFELFAADPDNRRTRGLLMLAASDRRHARRATPARRRLSRGRLSSSGWLRSQISRSPVSVRKSSTSSITTRTDGTSACASPPVASTAVSSPSSSRSRRTIPSTCPANPNTIPERIASTVDLPISARGSASSTFGSFAARAYSASIEISAPGADDPAQVLAGRRDDVVGDRGAEVDDDAGTADPIVGGDGVDEPVGAHLARVVDPDRHPGPDRRADDQHLVLEVAARHLGPLLRQLGHGRGDDRAIDVARSPARAGRAGCTARRRARPAWTRARWRTASARRRCRRRRG